MLYVGSLRLTSLGTLIAAGKWLPAEKKLRHVNSARGAYRSRCVTQIHIIFCIRLTALMALLVGCK